MKFAVISTFPPAHCGIAYFTEQLVQGLETSCSMHAMRVAVVGPEHDRSAHQDDAVIERDTPDSYREAIRRINASGARAIIVQHEYGLFGGECGSFLLPALRMARVPVVTVLHTILRHPSSAQRDVLRAITALSSKVIVPASTGARFLSTIYGLDECRITIIPHGAPTPAKDTRSVSKKTLGLSDRTILLTYGLISESKGIDVALRAVAKLAQNHAGLFYVVAGVTHPRVKFEQGERYRAGLYELVNELGIGDRVMFLDRRMDHAELGTLLDAADVYLCPYRSSEQIVSGTLATMLSYGRPIVTTPFWHAREIIEAGAATPITFNDVNSVTTAVSALLGNPEAVRRMTDAGRGLSSLNTWPRVCEQFANVLTRLDHLAIEKKASAPRGGNFAHLQKMTTSFGLLQHCRWSVPLYEEGYCTDDNARALQLCLQWPDSGVAEHLVDRYLAFVMFAFNRKTGRFRNFAAIDRRWSEDVGSEESHARAMRALAFVPHSVFAFGRQEMAKALLVEASAAVARFESTRARAIAILAMCQFAKATPDAAWAQGVATEAVSHVIDGFERHSSENWVWCEDHLTWFNAKIPHALIDFGQTFSSKRTLEVGLNALAWLTDLQIGEDSLFEPVGASTPFLRGGIKPRFDQQPIDAWATIAACGAAFAASGDKAWLEHADLAFDWFLGDNCRGMSLVDALSGACRDGVTPQGVNWNQGAESTLAWQLSIVDYAALMAVKAV